MIRKLRIEEGTTEANKSHIIELSKQYQVLSDYTAFLAISPVEATEDNRIGQHVSAAFTRAVADVLANVSVKLVHRHLIIEAPVGAFIQEVAVYDLK